LKSLSVGLSERVTDMLAM